MENKLLINKIVSNYFSNLTVTLIWVERYNSSCLMHSVKPVIANLIGGYSELVGRLPGTAWLVLCPRIELMLMIWPLTSRSFIDLIAWRVHKMFPTSSLSMIWRISFELFSSVRSAFVKTPPLFTRRSTPPNVFSTHVNAWATACSFAMSHSTALSWPLIFRSPTRNASTLSFLNWEKSN